jgi:hypothetical protein
MMHGAKFQGFEGDIRKTERASIPSINPILREFTLLSSLERLYVVHKKDSIVLFSHHFHHKDSCIDMDDLYGPALEMIDGLLGEILSSSGHIQEIMCDNKVIYFTQGACCSFIAIASARFDEMRTFLDKFAQDFEKIFSAKLDGQYNFAIDEYSNARSLILGLVDRLSNAR